MLKLHWMIVVGCTILMIRTTSSQTCGNVITTNCTQLTSSGFCQPAPITAQSATNVINNPDSFTVELTISNSAFLPPQKVQRCRDNTDGNKCCAKPCNPNPCQNNGTCNSLSEGDEVFSCICPPGFSGAWCHTVDTNIPTTQTDAPTTTSESTTGFQVILPTDGNACLNCDENANCLNGVCTCNAGYSGNGTICIEIPATQSNTMSPVTTNASIPEFHGLVPVTTNACLKCDRNAHCTEGICKCNAGYSGNGTVCTDSPAIVPVALNPCSSCDKNAKCTRGMCKCNPGYTGDGTSCTALPLSDTSTTACGKVIMVNCSHISSTGLCQPISIDVGQQSSNETFASGVIIQNVTFSNSTLLVPRFGPRCYNSSSGKKCCVDPCSWNPCQNNGTCRNSSTPNELFTCSCQSGFSGDWCQDVRKFIGPVMTGTCLKCDKNAKCTNRRCTCNVGYMGDGTFCTAICPAITITVKDQNCGERSISFNSSFEGQTQKSDQKCGNRALATITCRIGSTSFDQSTLNCVPCNETLRELLSNTTVSQNLTVNNIQRCLKKVAVFLTSNDETVDEIQETSKFIAKLSSVLTNSGTGVGNVIKKQINVETMRYVIIILEQITFRLKPASSDRPKRYSMDSIQKQGAAERKLRTATVTNENTLNHFARSVDLLGRDSLTIITERTTLYISKPKRTAGNQFGDIYFESKLFHQQRIDGNPTAVPQKKQSLQMRIPVATVILMDGLLDKKKEQELKFVFAAYDSSLHLTSDPRIGPVVQATFRPDDSNSAVNKFTNNFTICHQTPPLPTESQKNFVRGKRLKLRLNYFCVFWDYSSSKWSQKGCTFSNITTLGSAELNYSCNCNHFTSFGLLLRVTTNLEDYRQEYYSVVLGWISIIFLILTIIIYLTVKELRIRQPTPIMLNILINLVIGFILFLIGIDGRIKGFSSGACYTFTVLMHLVFLCCWFWLLLYSLNMYHALSQGGENKKSLVSKKPFMYVIGYILPLLIVILDLVISIWLDRKPKEIEATSYESHYIATHVCWLRSLSLNLAFVAPLGIIFLINIVIFFVAICKLTKNKYKSGDIKKNDIKQQIILAIAICFTMALTWIFCCLMLFAVDDGYQNAMEILFAISNIAQGVIIFYVCCLRKRSIRQLWMAKFCCCCCPEKKVKTVSSSSLSDHHSGGAEPPLLDYGETTGL